MKHVRAVTRRRPVKLLALAATGLAVTATMAACGGGSSDKSTATSDCPNGKITLHEEDYYLPASATNFTGTNTQGYNANPSTRPQPRGPSGRCRDRPPPPARAAA